jgi:hypothetical protein
MRTMVLACALSAIATAARAEGPRSDDGRWELGFGARSDFERTGPGGLWLSAGPRFGRFAVDLDAALGWFLRFRSDGTPDYSGGVLPQGGADERLSLVARARLWRIESGWAYGRRDRTTLSRSELAMSVAVAGGGERISREAMPVTFEPVASATLELAFGLHWDGRAADHPNDAQILVAGGPVVTPTQTATLVTIGMRVGL